MPRSGQRCACTPYKEKKFGLRLFKGLLESSVKQRWSWSSDETLVIDCRLCYIYGMAISNKAKLLVDTIVAKGCTITEASKLAGYKGVSSRVSASRMLHKPEVQAYMMAQVQKKIALGSTKAINTIVNLSDGANSEYVRLEASKDILDRAGFKAPDKHQHLIDGNFSINIDLT